MSSKTIKPSKTFNDRSKQHQPPTHGQSKQKETSSRYWPTKSNHKRYNYLLLKAFESSSPHRSPDRRCRCWGRTWCPDRCAPGCQSQSFRCRRSCSFSTRTHAPGSSRGEPIYSNSTRKFPQNTTANLNIHVNLNNSTLIQFFFREERWIFYSNVFYDFKFYSNFKHYNIKP